MKSVKLVKHCHIFLIFRSFVEGKRKRFGHYEQVLINSFLGLIRNLECVEVDKTAIHVMHRRSIYSEPHCLLQPASFFSDSNYFQNCSPHINAYWMLWSCQMVMAGVHHVLPLHNGNLSSHNCQAQVLVWSKNDVKTQKKDQSLHYNPNALTTTTTHPLMSYVQKC